MHSQTCLLFRYRPLALSVGWQAHYALNWAERNLLVLTTGHSASKSYLCAFSGEPSGGNFLCTLCCIPQSHTDGCAASWSLETQTSSDALCSQYWMVKLNWKTEQKQKNEAGEWCISQAPKNQLQQKWLCLKWHEQWINYFPFYILTLLVLELEYILQYEIIEVLI